jgi:hypothetical protein
MKKLMSMLILVLVLAVPIGLTPTTTPVSVLSLTSLPVTPMLTAVSNPVPMTLTFTEAQAITWPQECEIARAYGGHSRFHNGLCKWALNNNYT